MIHVRTIVRVGAFFAGAAFSLCLAGCVQHTWAPGPAASGDIGAVSGQCKLMAMTGQTGGGFVGASGSRQFVAAFVGASLITGAIASAVRENQIYNACLEANGFVAVETQQ